MTAGDVITISSKYRYVFGIFDIIRRRNLCVLVSSDDVISVLRRSCDAISVLRRSCDVISILT